METNTIFIFLFKKTKQWMNSYAIFYLHSVPKKVFFEKSI